MCRVPQARQYPLRRFPGFPLATRTRFLASTRYLLVASKPKCATRWNKTMESTRPNLADHGHPVAQLPSSKQARKRERKRDVIVSRQTKVVGTSKARGEVREQARLSMGAGEGKAQGWRKISRRDEMRARHHRDRTCGMDLNGYGKGVYNLTFITLPQRKARHGEGKRKGANTPHRPVSLSV